jgi:ParB-like nuclease domain
MKQNPKVEFTKNLAMFKFDKSNRDFSNPVSQNRIKRIARSMMESGLLPVPIIVTSRFIVVDGQHRLEAAKIAGCGIYFIIDYSIPNTSKGIFNAALKLNQDSKTWAKNDYIHGLAEMDIESYKILEEFGNKYPMFSLTERMMFLVNSASKGVNKDTFKKGEYQVKSVKKAETWVEFLLQIKPFFEKGYNRTNFVRAMISIMENKKEFNMDRFIHKMKLRPGMMKLCGDRHQYKEMIEDIYNLHSRPDDRLNLRF